MRISGEQWQPRVAAAPSASLDRLFAGPDASPFGRRQRRVRGARVPVTVVTGFLGAGKTTLIRALLATPEGAGTAVVVNEFGEIGIDDALLRASSDATVLLGNGCLCCVARSDLQETLRALVAERARGAVPNFRRVLIETSGLADPGPVLQTFASDRALGGEFHLQSLIAVVDAATGAGTLARHPEARQQIALADRIVLTKTDLVDEAARRHAIKQVQAFGTAPLAIARDGAIDPAFLLAEPVAELPGRLGEGPRAHAHTHGVASFVLFFDAPLPWAAFEQAMAVLVALRGPDLLRVKGLVAVAGCRGPVVIHAVQHVAHRPVELDEWPDADRRSRLVFVTRGLARDTVAALFAAVRATAEAAAPSP